MSTTEKQQSLELEDAIRNLKQRIAVLTSAGPNGALELDETVKRKLQLERQLSEIKNALQRREQENDRR